MQVVEGAREVGPDLSHEEEIRSGDVVVDEGGAEVAVGKLEHEQEGVRVGPSRRAGA